MLMTKLLTVINRLEHHLKHHLQKGGNIFGGFSVNLTVVNANILQKKSQAWKINSNSIFALGLWNNLLWVSMTTSNLQIQESGQ